MRITAYFERQRKLLAECPYIVSLSFDEDARTPNEGFLKASAVFVDGSRLELREYINASDDPVTRYSYSFHYQYQDSLIFRYDDTPHYPELPAFPHHKHAGPEVNPSSPVSLADVILEIENLLSHR